jgi:hypothetical protein
MHKETAAEHDWRLLAAMFHRRRQPAMTHDVTDSEYCWAQWSLSRRRPLAAPRAHHSRLVSMILHAPLRLLHGADGPPAGRWLAARWQEMGIQLPTAHNADSHMSPPSIFSTERPRRLERHIWYARSLPLGEARVATLCAVQRDRWDAWSPCSTQLFFCALTTTWTVLHRLSYKQRSLL